MNYLLWDVSRKSTLEGSSEKEKYAVLCDTILREVAARHHIQVIELTVASDHVHAVVKAKPSMSSSECLRLLKGASSRELFKQLRIQQVEEEHSRLLINEVLCRLSKDEYDRMDLHSQMLRESIMHKIKIPDSSFHSQEECKTVVFIGAAGTGKTTTISKLASDTKKRSDKEIVLISIKGYSTEKLKKTADRIGATLRTVTSNRELREIVDKNGSSSHIFIDTPGISYLDDNALSGIKGFLDEMPNMETHLVVSATTRYADIINIINKFTVFPIHRLLFTMVDETSLYGTLFSVAMETQIPLSCISDGQDIPEERR